MKLAVAGATGTVGRHVANLAEERGHTVVPITRSAGIDLSVVGGSNAALKSALDGVDAVIDVSAAATNSSVKSVRFFRTASANLLAAEIEASVDHHVVLSIVGIDGVDDGYYAGKLAQEATVTAGSVPWTLLRATQFHEFAGQVIQHASIGPFSLIPKATIQPVAAVEVARSLVELAEGKARGRVADLGGPAVENLADMARRYLHATGSRRRVVEVPLPGRMFQAMRDGSLLPSAGAQLGTQTFTQWVEALPH